MPPRWPVSAMAVSQLPRWPTASLSVSCADAHAAPAHRLAAASTPVNADFSLVIERSSRLLAVADAVLFKG
jgi:hypothetical protein